MFSVVARREAPVADRFDLRRAASLTAALIGVLYLLIFAGVLSVGRAEIGDLGVLGAAGSIFLTLAIALWRVHSRVLWAAAVVLQLLIAAMYVGVAPSREPAYEVWGVTIRVLSLVNVGILLRLLVLSRPRRGRSR